MIPQTIHYCWLSGDPYPELIARCIKTWQEYLPGYKFVLWDKHKADIDKVTWVKEAYENKKYAFAADYLRLYALYTEGGIYLDADVEVMKNFSPLLAHQSFIGQETGGDFEPAIIGAHAGTEWIKKCLDYYRDRHFRKADGTFDIRPLPIIVEEILNANYNMPCDISKIITIEEAGLTLYPAEYFSPKNIHSKKNKRTSNSYAIHHFDGSWLSKTTPTWFAKQALHRLLLLLTGEKGHRAIVRKIRKIKIWSVVRN
jgi:mannosyltransferase OCH1-like enzyme